MSAIKEHGGLTLSQAEFDHHAKSGMPYNAASAGFVDHVLAAEDMPAALLDYQRHRQAIDGVDGRDAASLDPTAELGTICAILQNKLGRDFSQYRPGTLTRRIQRRMRVAQTADVADYIEQLRAQPGEAELLFREFLIGVTRFFRDPEALAALAARAIPDLLADERGTDRVRVWVAGCATGEEAYSIAILLREAMAGTDGARAVQIFATDIDDRAIEIARAGLYPVSIAADLSPERLERHFVLENGLYRVNKDLREMCLFTVHDLTCDPSFSRLDLISCRNLMIYFDPRLQHRVVGTFHYALRQGGCLLLGASEGVTAQPHLFAAIDERMRLYARRDGPPSLPTFSLLRYPERPPPANPAPGQGMSEIDRRAARAVAQYAPAFVVVDHHHDILRFSGKTARMLQPADGIASLNLFALLHPDLRPAARAALRQAAATGAAVLHQDLVLLVGEREEIIELIVEPLPDLRGESLFLVAFQDRGAKSKAGRDSAADAQAGAGDVDVAVLHRELLAVRDRLRNVSEEFAVSQEQLQNSHQEFLSVNEELRSANEELETSKEELQSLNEELQTINAELHVRNDSLVRANSDLANLFDSTSIATLFVDNDLRIRRFTPRLLEIFNLREGDEGRPISDIVTRLTRDGLDSDVRQVLRSLVAVEREMEASEGGSSYLMQVRPYRDLNNVIDGAVVTFVDISERKRHERTRALLASIVESSRDAIVSHDLDGTITSWNAGAEALYGYPGHEAIGRPVSMLLGDTHPEDWQHLAATIERGERVTHFDSTRTAKDGRSIEVSVTISPVREEAGRIVGASVVARDISERHDAEQKAGLLLGELDHRVKNILAIVSAVVAQTLKADLSPELFAVEIQGRIQAIAKAHSLLTQSGHGAMSLRALLETELAPYDRGAASLAIDGDDLALTPKAGMALAMAVHELASNAAKYGALSARLGHLAVTATIAATSGEPSLTLLWTETGGPAVMPPTRRGFGTTLIERALTSELDAEVQREFPASGLRCRIVIPLTPEICRSEGKPP